MDSESEHWTATAPQIRDGWETKCIAVFKRRNAVYVPQMCRNTTWPWSPALPSQLAQARIHLWGESVFTRLYQWHRESCEFTSAFRHTEQPFGSPSRFSDYPDVESISSTGVLNSSSAALHHIETAEECHWVVGMKSWPIIIPHWSMTCWGQAWTAGATSHRAPPVLQRCCHGAKCAPPQISFCCHWRMGKKRCEKKTVPVI
jgi:hypothetical protein